MNNNTVKKRFFASHAKSSAAVISLVLHAVILILAVSFVAVKVIQKNDQNFEAKPVVRPKMQLKKLQVPVTVKKKKPKPKLRKRIVAKTRMNKNMPDLKMPEITGVKGGIGNSNGSGLGTAAGIGFSMPQFEIFGIKGKGEKVFLILDASPQMMYDEMGGIPAYTIIKEELARIVDELPSTALFNLCVYERGYTALLFPQMVSANEANLQKVKTWLEPLNAVKKGMGDRDYGLKTLGPGGQHRGDDVRVGPFVRNGRKVGGHDTWFRPVMLAMQMQADTVFILGHSWGTHRYAVTASDNSKWKGSAAEQKWNECYKKGLAMLNEENRKRKAAGKPPKVLERNIWAINKHYFPSIQRPPGPQWHYFTVKEFVEAFHVMREKHASQEIQAKSGLSSTGKKSRHRKFSLNVVYFSKKGSGSGGGSFKQLSAACRGKISTVEGMNAIENYVSASAYNSE